MSKPAEGAWFGRSADHYVTKGASCVRIPGQGWFVRCADRVRGPMSSLEAAMTAADKMLAESATRPPASERAA